MLSLAGSWRALAAHWLNVVAAMTAALGLGLLAAGCGERTPVRTPGPLRIVVSIAPLAELARALAPDAQVTILIPPGASEHGYELTPDDVSRVSRADLVVGVGLGLEARLESVLASLRSSGVRRAAIASEVGAPNQPAGGSASSSPPATRGPRVVWFQQVLSPAEGGSDAHEGHSHASGGDHDDHAAHDDHHHAVDPHLWLDPVLVERFVPVLSDAVAAAYTDAGAPVSDTEMAARTESLRDRVAATDRACRQAMAPFRGRSIVTHHASHGRFAARYGLEVGGVIRITETLEPTPAQVQDVVMQIQTASVPAVFVEPQFDSSTAQRIAEAAGVRVVVLDPIGDGDWFALMEHTSRTIAGALGGTPAASPEVEPE